MLTRLLDFISPRTCPCCGNRLMPSEEALCVACRVMFPLTNHHDNPEENEVAHMFHGAVRLKWAIAWYYYDRLDMHKNIITNFKYSGDIALGAALTNWACSTVMPLGLFDDIDVIVPLPLTRGRQRERGFNQCEVIADEMHRLTGIPVSRKAMRRNIFRASQASRNAIERFNNVKDVFEMVNPDTLRGKHVMVVDDVITTGATMRSFILELAKAQPRLISIFVLAKAI